MIRNSLYLIFSVMLLGCANREQIIIGDFYQGGIIAYLLQPGDIGYDPNTPHGIIVSPVDQAIWAKWGCNRRTIGNTQFEIGYGAANTAAIVHGCEEAIAAKICDDLVLNGYSDWCLPSIDELFMLHLLHENDIGDFKQKSYWSSTENEEYQDNQCYVWKLDFSTGEAQPAAKDRSYCIRAVRAF